MKKRKFKKTLVKQVKSDEKEELRQEQLKEKYRLKNNDVIVVEKSNTVKFLLRTLGGLVKLSATIIIFLLSIVGLAAIIYPASRAVLINQALQIYQELLHFLPL